MVHDGSIRMRHGHRLSRRKSARQFRFAPPAGLAIRFDRAETYAWKRHDLNAPSKRAAPRLGFAFEGVFRRHMIVKGRNRGAAWFSTLDAQ